MTTTPIILLPQKKGSNLPQILLSDLDGNQKTIACDCYVAGIERQGTTKPWGWQYGPHENIDHHAPVDEMARQVSSANLAILRVEVLGHALPGDHILITHTDCDSILSAGIVAGRLDPHDRYGAAAIAADHTGEPNDIADLLQAIQNHRELDFAFKMLAYLEAGTRLPANARQMLDNRLRKRDQAAEDVAQGRVAHLGSGIYFAQFDHETDGEFFPALLPAARLILIGMPPPEPEKARPWVIKVRRGLAMPDGRDLRHLDLEQFDNNYGGRWNAGSNKRGGGTAMAPRQWAEGLVEWVGARLPS